MAGRGVWAEISLSALRHNMRLIKKKIAPGARLCAVVKADAYGHGALAVARTALEEGADYLAVAVASEAVRLREAGITAPMMLLGPTQYEEADVVVDNDLTQAVFSVEATRAISEAAVRRGKCAKVHLAIDTGMGRIGVRPEEAGRLASEISTLQKIFIEGVFSHFALADVRDKEHARWQLSRFMGAVREIEDAGVKVPIRHIANSAATLEMPDTHLDMVRPGVILYGIWPSDEVRRDIDLRPAMKLKARLTHVKEIFPGETVSYGCTFKATKKTIVGTLPLGYADGYTRLYSGKAKVEVKGKRVPVLGRICMDQCMIDLSDVPDAVTGDEVTVFGSTTLAAEEVASWSGTIAYEVVTAISSRVPRVYVDDFRC